MNHRSRFGIILLLSFIGVLFSNTPSSSADALETLLPSAGTSVSGMVYDGGVEGGESHGYPLYASLTFTAPGFTQTIYNDPFTGAYQVDLNSGQTYTVTVSAVTNGYETQKIDLVVGSSPIARDFHLFVDATSCSAPGYSGGAFFEDFEGGGLPAGWVNYDHAVTGEVWEFLLDPPNENKTPGEGGFAILDSDRYGDLGYQDAGLRTPAMNFSSASSVILSFDMDFVSWYATVAVRISGDNGVTWTTRKSWTTDETASISLDISTLAAGNAQVIVEFRYTGDPVEPWGFWWQVDNVRIEAGECSLVPGGVVAGYVLDENTGAPLIGADVVSPDLAVQSTALADDLQNTGLYWAFQPAAADPTQVTFTASFENYASDSQTVAVRPNRVTRQDFSLGTGYLAFNPGGFEITLKLGDAALNDTLTISNTGALPVNFNLKLVNKPFPHTPAFAIGYPGENLAYIPDTVTPNNWTIIGSVDDPIEDRDFIAGDFVGGDFSKLYVMDFNSDTLFALNTTTAIYAEIGLATAEGDWTGLTGTPEGVLYGISTNCSTFTNLYTLDTDTAAATNLVPLAGIRCGNDLAYNPDDGLIYIIDTYSSHLFKIDPSTLEVTNIGELGMNTNYAQGLDFEEHSGLLFWAANDYISGQNELRIIDTMTGSSYSLGVFPGDERVPVLAFATSGVRQWMSLSPAAGILQPGGAVNVTLTADPAVLDHPGIYQAEIITLHDTVYEVAHIPVKLNLQGPPAIISPDQITFTVGVESEFTIRASGFPIPVLDYEGNLPVGVTFTPHGDGTATLSGTPQAGQGGIHVFTITASNGYEPDAVQDFLLTVCEAPKITSAQTASFTVGENGLFTITTVGFPEPDIEVAEALPNGIQLIDIGNGTATLAGIPQVGQGGVHLFTITASNGIDPDAHQEFTLTINEAPKITSDPQASFPVGKLSTFLVTTTGMPAPQLWLSDDLPGWVIFHDNGDGTATLSGTPAEGLEGENFEFPITASNGIDPDAVQVFTLFVVEKQDENFSIFLPLITR